MASFNEKLTVALSEDLYRDIDRALGDIESGKSGSRAGETLDDIDKGIVDLLQSRRSNRRDTEELADRSLNVRKKLHKNGLLRSKGPISSKLGSRGRLNNPKDLAGDMLGQLIDLT